MVQTYQEFKDYLITFLWKAGDLQVINELDNLIIMAENKLNRELLIEQRHRSITFPVSNQRETLPDDYYSMRSVAEIDGPLGQLRYVPPSELIEERTLTGGMCWSPVYSLEDNSILFVGPAEGGRSSTGPNPPPNPQAGDLWFRTSGSTGLYVYVVDTDSSQWVQSTTEGAAQVTDGSTSKIFSIEYLASVPKFKDTDSSWLTAHHLDLYVYATLWHSAPFLREDERLQVWSNMYTSSLAAALELSAHEQVRGISASPALPRQASPNRYRSIYSRR